MGGGQKNPRSAEPSGVPGLGIGMYASGPRVDWHEAGQGNSVALMLRLPVDVDCSEPEGLEGGMWGGVSHVGISQPPAPNQWTVASSLQLTHASSGTLTQAPSYPGRGRAHCAEVFSRTFLTHSPLCVPWALAGTSQETLPAFSLPAPAWLCPTQVSQPRQHPCSSPPHLASCLSPSSSCSDLPIGSPPPHCQAASVGPSRWEPYLL